MSAREPEPSRPPASPGRRHRRHPARRSHRVNPSRAGNSQAPTGRRAIDQASQIPRQPRYALAPHQPGRRTEWRQIVDIAGRQAKG
jgi:hypothetical protein